MTKEERYVHLARESITELIRREHACLWLEIEAKLSERPHPRMPNRRGLDPHILMQARHQLVEEEVIQQTEEPTRGGRIIPIIGFKDLSGRAIAFNKAASRKRLLQSRYLRWAEVSSDRTFSIIGAAGERVARASLRADAHVGFVPVNESGTDVSRLFEKPVPGGPRDDAAYLMPLQLGVPSGFFATVPIEVKNVRHWIYSSSDELYQLLDKAAKLHLDNPSRNFVPILVCRRSHTTAFRMAKDLGFIIFYLGVQPILSHPEAPPERIEEVRGELGYDIHVTEGPHHGLTSAFRSTVNIAERTAERWALSSLALSTYFAELRKPSLSVLRRRELMEELRKVAADKLPEIAGGW